jgi:hypothetical protein
MLNYWAVLSCFVSFPDLFMFFVFVFVFKDYAYGIYVLSDFGISRLCKLGFRKNVSYGDVFSFFPSLGFVFVF